MSFLSNEQRFSTFVDVLVHRARHQPDRLAFTFLQGDATDPVSMTYAHLDSRARAIAVSLRTTSAVGDRALLLYPPGLDFVTAFFGCLYAGVVPVPAYPPKRNQKLQRLQSILTDAEPAAILTTASVAGGVKAHFADSPGIKKLWLMETDTVDDALASSWSRPAIEGSGLAFLQYTSGSTSTPKGVMVGHANLLHNSAQIRHAFGLTPEDVSVSWLPSFHDMGLIDGILQPIFSGFPAYLMSPTAFLQQPIRWLKTISDYRATHSGGPNFAYEHCVKRTTPEQREGLDLSCWTMAYNGAEPIRRSTLEAFAAEFAPHGFRPQSFYPCYGLAEATLMVTGGIVSEAAVFCEVDAQRLEQHKVVTASSSEDKPVVLVGSGRVHLDTNVLIVDPESRTRCGRDQVGEIWVSGGSVAMGYWHHAEKTEEVFRARLADTGEGPFMRTGDLGFFRDGELFVTGRLKDLIIIRGRNHYPQDIELTAQQSHPALRPDVGAAFSVVVEGSDRLVVVLELDRVALRKANPDEIISAVRSNIAEQHELQAYAVVLLKPGQLPKTSSGKIQRSACRALFVTGALEDIGKSVLDSEAETDAPLALTRDELLALSPDMRRVRLADHLRRVVSRALRLPSALVDSQNTLLQLGMDSLSATEVQHRLEGELGITVSLVLFLQNSTVEQLADQVLAHVGDTSKPLARPPPRESGQPLSRGQQALWFLHQMAPASAAYNVSFAVRVVSELDAEALCEALRVLTKRHSALRTSFESVGGQPVQRVHDAPAVDYERIDASCWSQEEFDKHLLESTHRPFDLREAPLLRTRLFHRGPRDHVLLMTAHHLVVDFWSLVVLLDELATVYPGAKARQPITPLPPTSQPSDYTNWQEGLLASPAGEALWDYWRQQLAGARPVLRLPTDKPRPPVQSFHGALHVSQWDKGLVEKVRELAASRGATPYMLLLAAFQVLLHRYTGQDDIVVGSSVAGRTRSEFSGTVGYLVNQLALRAQMAGNPTFDEFLRQIRRTVLDALAHQDAPLPLLVERLQPERDSSHSPLFQTMFVLDKPHRQQAIASLVTGVPGASGNLGELSLESMVLEQRTAQFDLTVKVSDGGDTMMVVWEYSSDLFDASTIQRMSGHLRTLLEALIAAPSQRIGALSLLSTVERRQLLVEWNDTQAPYPTDRCMHELFEAQVARTPETIALACTDQVLSYADLNDRANQVAHHLIRLGVGPESLVGVCMLRSIELVVALLGVLKAGGAYVPLDPSYPEQRLAYMLEDASVAALLTQRALLPRLPASAAHVLCLDADGDALARSDRSNPVGRATPAHLAYVIYTSGSTGRPKGAMVEHRGLVNYLSWCTRAYAVEGGTGAPVVTSIGFDATITSLFAPLLVGRKVVLLREQEELSALLDALRARQDFSLVKLTPAHLDLLKSSMPAKEARVSTRAFVVGGEALPKESVTFWRTHAPDTKIINEYGPTETVVGCCVHEVKDLSFPSGNVPIGRPIANTQLYILDAYLQPVPIGVPGELYIGGAGVARGYLRRPELTAERFVHNPFREEPGARMYRTGDLARYLPDGKLEFLGRIDDQVKIRGFRVELGEIEAVLRQHPEVQDAAVIVRHDTRGTSRLVAYVVWKDVSANAMPMEVRRFLSELLPHYMVPASIISLEALPLTSHGKIDRRALPDLDSARPGLEVAYVLPGSEMERLIATVWQGVLRVDKVGINDNFFELGGHSLLAAQVHHKLQEELKREISLVQLFQYPTVRSLADYLSRGKESTPDLQRIQDRIKKQKRALRSNRKKRERP